MTAKVQISSATDLVQEVYFDSGRYRLFGKMRTVSRRAPAILLLHGLGFHSFEYDALASLLAQGGLNSLAFDFRCHGRSEGPRGRWVLQDLVDDAEKAAEFLSQRVEGNIGVFGNSLGAIVGIYLASRSPQVKSLVASGCPTRVADFGVTTFRKVLLNLLQGLAVLVPLRVSANYFIPYHRILQIPRIITQVRSDPLITDARRFAPATFADMFKWNALEIIGEVNIPLLVLYATQDGLQPPEQSTMLFAAARGQKEIRAMDTSHVPDLEYPELLCPILHEWFSRTLSTRKTQFESPAQRRG